MTWCDWWLPTRAKCPAEATVMARDEHGAPFGYCAEHWPLACRPSSLGPRLTPEPADTPRGNSELHSAEAW